MGRRVYNSMKKGLEGLIDSGKTSVPGGGDPLVLPKDANLNVLLWGDPQISLLSPYRSSRIYSARLDVKNSNQIFDALVILGDVTEYGTVSEYKFTKDLLSPVAGNFKNIFAVSGNHDIRLRPHVTQVKRFSSFLREIENGRPNPFDRFWFSRRVNGYKFIMMGSDASTFEASYLSEKQLSWLDDEIKEEQGKPVFVFNHQTLKRTNGLPESWLGKGDWRGSVGLQSKKLENIFKKYKNIIFITGHLHYTTSGFTYEDRGSYKALSVPTTGVVNHGESGEYTEEYILSAFDDKIIARSRVAGKGKYKDKSVPNAEITIKIE